MVERGAQIYWCWSARAVLNASRDFAHATVSGRWFQRMTVSTKKLFWYWAVLLFGMVKHFVLLVLCFSTGLMVKQSPNIFGFICLLHLLNVTTPQPPCTLKWDGGFVVFLPVFLALIFFSFSLCTPFLCFYYPF